MTHRTSCICTFREPSFYKSFDVKTSYWLFETTKQTFYVKG